MTRWDELFRQAGEKCTSAAEYRNLRAENEFDAADELDNDLPRDEGVGAAMEKALEDLRTRHLAFRRPEKGEERDLDELRLQVSTAATQSPNLLDYYREAWGVTSAEPPSPPTPSSAYRRIALMQVELMLRAFSTLQLQRFANAPENRGWMELFRQWGRSPRFNRIFDEVRRTLLPQFVKFYDKYLKDIDGFTGWHGIAPIHHPWLPREGSEVRGRGLYMDSGLVEGEIEIEVRPGTAAITNPNNAEGSDTASETPSNAASDGGSEPTAGE